MSENRIEKVVSQYVNNEISYEHALGLLEAFGIWESDADDMLCKAAKEALEKN
jgi:hypothetical protein